MDISISCIGSGNMGPALLKGAAPYSKIFFTDSDLEKARNAAFPLRAQVLETNTQAAEKGEFVFLAVKPQVLPDVLAEIAPVSQKRFEAGENPVFVSMAAGWSIEKIQTALGAKIPVIRMMPNTPALIGKGMIAYSVSNEVPAQRITQLEKILNYCGICDRVEEKYLNAVTGLSGSGPAYVYLFVEALALGGVNAGLEKDKALIYAAQTVLGAAAMLQETGKPPQELIDMVTSPGGTTLAGLAALKDGGFCEAVNNAVQEAKNRAAELG